ncbi:MmgE/PrpD family protein [Pseudonocardia dioxanivorans CB1190]|uniref:MmgE/PrpD family protein n=1 Tax=Pseudonocardia dioxanivorans (strain ATCC 55486 / DSM 44775 / JCM 13855 / CB1190) TaxID=675635 RepID=F4CUP9_PSEUX|nr:MmgE/PrpD family protein [Pseudonocardia dioxanivorans]AEA26363.1 MmgE/PrpD family protein [Pseudonocardia dioxanivorans CB1190]
MAERTLAEHLAAFAAKSTQSQLPGDVAASVGRRVLDVLGLCVAALDLPTSRAALDHVAEQGGAPQAHAVGLPTAVPAAWAAFANGVTAHSLDYDDTHLPSVLHPSAAVVPAALAAAEYAGASGARTVEAIAVGLEITVRLGMAGYDERLGNSVFFEHGQHATSICGAMGGAAAAALLLDLGEDGVRDALGITASMAAGVIEANRTGGTVKRVHCGWAAHSAVTAAQLVRRGFTGPPTVLEGRFGFFEAFLRGEADPAAITDGLGDEWAVPGIFFKPYPANHFTHTAVDAAARLRERGVRPQDVTSATLGVPGAVIRTIGEPIETKRAPVTGYQAQFSGPYAVAVGLFGGGGLGAALADYTDALAADPDRRALMAKVDVVADARCDAVFPHQFPAVLRVTTADGREWTEEVLTNRGGPDRPLTDAEHARKFRDNLAVTLPADVAGAVADEVTDTVLGLAASDDPAVVGRLLARLTPTFSDTEE